MLKFLPPVQEAKISRSTILLLIDIVCDSCSLLTSFFLHSSISSSDQQSDETLSGGSTPERGSSHQSGGFGGESPIRMHVSNKPSSVDPPQRRRELSAQRQYFDKSARFTARLSIFSYWGELDGG